MTSSVLRNLLSITIIVTIICFELSLSISCYYCVSKISTTSDAWIAYSKGFNLPNDSITANCAGSPTSVPTYSDCTHSCLTVLTNNTEISFALRGCADTMITSGQWSGMGMTSSSVEAKCFVSSTPSTSTAIPATAKMCFCTTDKCNSQLYKDISSSRGLKLRGSSTIYAILIMVVFIVKNCSNQ